MGIGLTAVVLLSLAFIFPQVAAWTLAVILAGAFLVVVLGMLVWAFVRVWWDVKRAFGSR